MPSGLPSLTLFAVVWLHLVSMWGFSLRSRPKPRSRSLLGGCTNLGSDLTFTRAVRKNPHFSGAESNPEEDAFGVVKTCILWTDGRCLCAELGNQVGKCRVMLN